MPAGSNVSAQGKVLMRVSSGAGPVEEGVAHDGVETDATGFKLSDIIPARGTLNTAVDLVPTLQDSVTINNGATKTYDIPIATNKSFVYSVRVEVVDGSHGWLYLKRMSVDGRNIAGAVEIIGPPSVGNESVNTGVTGWTVTAAQNGANLRISIANTSGSNRTVATSGGGVFQDRA